MKKILLVIICFLFISVVDARTLTIQEITTGFMDSAIIKEINASAEENQKISIANNTDNNSIDIYIGDNVHRSYSYLDGAISHEDTREINTENANDQLADIIFYYGLVDSVITKSGFDFQRVNEVPSDFVWDYQAYNLYLETEKYDFGGGQSGDFLREFKVGFDTDKITAFVNAVGLKEEDNVKDLVPAIKVTKKTKNSVTLSVFVADNSKERFCYIYKSETKDGEYEKLSEMAVSCSKTITSYIDEDIYPNKTYYYKSMVLGGEKFSNIVKVSTYDKVVNPDTGNNQIIPLLIGFIISMVALFIFHKNSGIKL